MAVTALCVTTTLYLLRLRQQERFDRMRGAVATCLRDMYHIGVALALYKEDLRVARPGNPPMSADGGGALGASP